jgi:hypothetical protein
MESLDAHAVRRGTFGKDRQVSPGVDLICDLFLLSPGTCAGPATERRAGFVSVTDVDPSIELYIPYHMANNFVGRPNAPAAADLF